MKNRVRRLFMLLFSLTALLAVFGTGSAANAAAADQPIQIVQQPGDLVFDLGVQERVSVTAVGNHLTYQWYYQLPDSNEWVLWQGRTKSSISAVYHAYWNDRRVKCVISDNSGNQIETNVVTYRLKSDLAIIEQTKEVIAQAGVKTPLQVKARGMELSYQWMYRTGEETEWIVWADRTKASISVPFSKKWDKRYVKCVITDKTGFSIESEPILVTVNEAPLEPQPVFTVKDSILSEERLTAFQVRLSKESYCRELTLADMTASLVLRNVLSISDSEEFLLHFTAFAESFCGRLAVSVNDGEYRGSFVLPVTETEYIIPISGIKEIQRIDVSLATETQQVTIGNLELCSCNSSDISGMNTGLFDIDPNSVSSVLEESEGIGYASSDVATDGSYLYSVNKGTLLVYSLENPAKPVLVGKMNGIGASREIAVIGNRNALAISSRENGVFFVDVSEPTMPVILSAIGTQGLATGIAVEDNYCFVCSRNFGTEIFDISDLQNPTFCAQVSANEEFYDCAVSDGYLYVSVWQQRKIRIYSLTDVYHPVEVSMIQLDGSGGGCTVRDGILYVATGYHGAESTARVTDSGYGMGNGFVCYDVSDPANPIWLSCAKIDGRYYYSGFDHWRVSVAGDYAYLSSVYNGLFIYDISDPRAPIRVSKTTVLISRDSEHYRKLTTGKYLHTFDVTQHFQGDISGTAIVDGYVYFGTENGDYYEYTKQEIPAGGEHKSGLFVMPFEGAVYELKSNAGLSGSAPKEYKTGAVLKGCRLNQYDLGSSVYAVQPFENRIFAACGAEGIMILDENYTVLERVKTESFVKDLVICNGFLYAAEGNAGLGVYSIAPGGTLEKLGGGYSFTKFDSVVTALRAYKGGSFLLAQLGWTQYANIDIRDPYHLKIGEISNIGTMYYRNISSVEEPADVLCAYGRSSIVWYSQTGDEIPKDIVKLNNTFNAETNGTTMKGTSAITIYNNGYVFYDPEGITQQQLDALSVIKVPGTKYLKGKPIVFGNTMVVSYSYGHQVTIIDITDLNNPALIGQIMVDGNPDIASKDGNKILIPLHYGGILTIEGLLPV